MKAETIQTKRDDDFDQNSIKEWLKRGVVIEGNSASRKNPDISVGAAQADFWKMVDALQLELKTKENAPKYRELA